MFGTNQTDQEGKFTNWTQPAAGRSASGFKVFKTMDCHTL